MRAINVTAGRPHHLRIVNEPITSIAEEPIMFAAENGNSQTFIRIGIYDSQNNIVDYEIPMTVKMQCTYTSELLGVTKGQGVDGFATFFDLVPILKEEIPNEMLSSSVPMATPQVYGNTTQSWTAPMCMLEFSCSTSQVLFSRAFYVRLLSEVEILHQPKDGGNLEPLEFERISDSQTVSTMKVALKDPQGFVLPSRRLVRLSINDIRPNLGNTPGSGLCACGISECFSGFQRVDS
jgi:hypothetical protein